MIITRTPLRISLFGGGSDFPGHYGKHGGAVLSTTIDKFIDVTVSPRFDDSIVVVYSQVEKVNQVGAINHGIVREALNAVYYDRIVIKRKQPPGIEIRTRADITSRGSGLGSSSTVAVGVLLALYTMEHKRPDSETLANWAIQIELVKLQKPIGIQDQIAAAWGGLNLIEFDARGIPDAHNRIIPRPVDIDQDIIDRLDKNLLLFFTGKTRHSVIILKEQEANNDKNTDTLNVMSQMARHGVDMLRAGKVDEIGLLLHSAWCRKKQLASGITTPTIDRMYQRGLDAGALGGKVCGAGGGGFMLFYCPDGTHEDVRAAMSEYRELPFRFEKSGARVVFDDR